MLLSTLRWYKKVCFLAWFRKLICSQKLWAFYGEIMEYPFLHERKPYLSPTWYIYFSSVRAIILVISNILGVYRNFSRIRFFMPVLWKFILMCLIVSVMVIMNLVYKSYIYFINYTFLLRINFLNVHLDVFLHGTNVEWLHEIQNSLLVN